MKLQLTLLFIVKSLYKILAEENLGNIGIQNSMVVVAPRLFCSQNIELPRLKPSNQV
jgi:hypothetical protein